eukprot:TRINITY_DN40054_c0_g1_i2.p1 TRINITY_DN40054_c0_g1~~TRINITY_DN40054_c0_g1_i2.p1  ORF type:complete len:246 (-),score=40.85 TRINITY_DN40054_c0_g1_i2:146-883(-)
MCIRDRSTGTSRHRTMPTFTRWVVGLIASVFLVTGAESLSVTINNLGPRRDTNGNILNAHDGQIIGPINGTFWMFGTSYTHCNMNDSSSCLGTCPARNQSQCSYPNSPDFKPNHPACGWTNNDFAAYSSPDLTSWTLRNPSILPGDARPNGIYFRPKVLYDPTSKKYVLWFNYVTAGWECPASFPNCWSVYGTATSSQPQGPYSIAKLPVLMGTGNLSYAHGDFGLFGPDQDGKAYILYLSLIHI